MPLFDKDRKLAHSLHDEISERAMARARRRAMAEPEPEYRDSWVPAWVPTWLVEAAKIAFMVVVFVYILVAFVGGLLLLAAAMVPA